MSFTRHILGMRVDPLTPSIASRTIIDWARSKQSGTVCVANVHMTMESYDDPEFQAIVNAADMVVPDGMPLVWALKLLGHTEVDRVCGPDLVLSVCKAAEEASLPIALYGGTEDRLDEFNSVLGERYPGLDVVCRIAPPFRSLTEDEEQSYAETLLRSGARIIFVGIGCPKQERWMHRNRDRMDAVLIGVGAAFDFHSGHIRRAPAWMGKLGLEWIFRLAMDPKRLWKRYLHHNPRFVLYFMRQLLTARHRKQSSPPRDIRSHRNIPQARSRSSVSRLASRQSVSESVEN